MKIILVAALLMLISCSKTNPNKNSTDLELPYELKQSESGISFEVFSDSITDENKYNYDNEVLKVGRSFTYAFKHITKEGKELYFEKFRADGDLQWAFVSADHPGAIKTLTIKVMPGNAMAETIPDYNQTNLKYLLGDDSSYSISGGVENDANIWIHPPRDLYFEILELNPFPYVKRPLKPGHSWTWKLSIGDSWSDSRWKVWEGTISNQYTYRIDSKQSIKTPLGQLECYIIKSKAESRIGDTYLLAYYNEDYGFVKLEYTNIDGSKTLLDILQVEDGD